jgi:hypothetical protein
MMGEVGRQEGAAAAVAGARHPAVDHAAAEGGAVVEGSGHGGDGTGGAPPQVTSPKAAVDAKDNAEDAKGKKSTSSYSR